ncbi:hypothetical protein AC477_02135 [miscellaneous Crenarchaeota group-1 archaeon SG8-32-1]|uniref:Calcineurin-like phosphoesterase domain-containing protein n=1 Tax=miscellaneous Crenarchaeota group-1 archaeon SG8-32-1 TaxID=1685124 RepID=A0A0M0BX49_9ARCH|nr:MAG: hypothetical protein AC477_02135 [miscellaneous Crenarchaeota group-1 archaeon SG8-32-1]
MDGTSIRFLHLSDTHFGVHYSLKPRNPLKRVYGELFFQKVEKLIHEAISNHKIDFIIHSGDFFNRSKPPPEVIDRAVKPFQLATRKGIPVFIAPGNHERSRLPLGLLQFFNDNFNLFTDPRSYYFEKNGISIKITGLPYIKNNARYTFSEIVNKAWNNSTDNNEMRYDYSILAIHQLLAGSQIENYTFSRGQDVIPKLQTLKKFNYIACGHVHRFQFLYDKESTLWKPSNRFRLAEQDHNKCNWHFADQKSDDSQFPSPIIAYAGSLERVSFMERNEPKGYIIGELKPSTKARKKMKLKCQFHELPAIKMIYDTWDLSKLSLNDCINQTLKNMYDIKSYSKFYLNECQRELAGIIKIGIKGKLLRNNVLVDFLKEEARKLRFYLTFRLYS